jgi:hypothetical protein
MMLLFRTSFSSIERDLLTSSAGHAMYQNDETKLNSASDQVIKYSVLHLTDVSQRSPVYLQGVTVKINSLHWL